MKKNKSDNDQEKRGEQRSRQVEKRADKSNNATRSQRGTASGKAKH